MTKQPHLMQESQDPLPGEEDAGSPVNVIGKLLLVLFPFLLLGLFFLLQRLIG